MQKSFGFTDNQSNQQESVSVDVENDHVHETARQEESEQQTESFWVASDQLFNPYLIVWPKENNEEPYTINVYDCAGKISKSAKVIFPAKQISYFDLEGICSTNRMQDGICQSNVQVIAPVASKITIDYASSVDDLRFYPRQELQRNTAVCLPIHFTPACRNLFFLNSTSAKEQSVKIRLFIAGRAPEIEFKLAANGTLAKTVESEFSEYLDLQETGALGYLRFVSSTNEPVYVQTCERYQNTISDETRVEQETICQPKSDPNLSF